MKLRHHQNLSVEKWGGYPFFKQILMIANELNRAINWLKKEDFKEVKLCYERAFELIYLTVACLREKNKLRELLRVKEMLSLFYTQDMPGLELNLKLLNALLVLDRNSFCCLNRENAGS